MVHEMTPLRLMVVGFTLLLASWLVLLLMVAGRIAPSLLLSLGTYAVSMAGLAVGLFGAVQYVRHTRRGESGPTDGYHR